MSLASAPLPSDPAALRAFAAGLQAELAASGVDIGARAHLAPEQTFAAEIPEDAADESEPAGLDGSAQDETAPAAAN